MSKLNVNNSQIVLLDVSTQLLAGMASKGLLDHHAVENSVRFALLLIEEVDKVALKPEVNPVTYSLGTELISINLDSTTKSITANSKSNTKETK